RLYVDAMLEGWKPRAVAPDVEARLRQSGSVSELLESVSHELSRASHHVGFALATGVPASRLQHIEFVRVEGTRVLVIVVSTGGQVTHKLVDFDERCDRTTLLEAANYINMEFAGLTLDEVRTAIVDRLQQERMLYDALAARALRLAQDGLGPKVAEDTLH